ncbi:FAD-dependent oxidoreductase [Streptomyces sp. H10-C2]|uniref:NAD(P)/FAD-dependent oxidoreductase n=1 Tax=unclassified Streptomyces TaxID=2593676 RepID=UPI0024B8F04A|nr:MULTISPECIES: FAD-dependent oxidoreductase [unclassified Streptomyces]MDJ0342941.1 FAD-dependent oxidoreductase [Streptomyces sp. PH10-H1]MDJ0371497.1 FAD-dependent oxidoreductase [Streptomyces sp. H10-C2]
MADRRRVAVIGSGIGGLTAAYVLRRTHDVVLFEADARLGGHADTHEVVTAAGRALAVDTGFIVHNRRTYPLLSRLFAELGVTTQETDMSMSVRCDGCGLEYAGARGGPAGLFARPSNAANVRYLRLLTQVPRFHRAARDLLARPCGGPEPTLGAFLAERRFSPYFVSHFITPLVSAVWSCGSSEAAGYPARYLFRFLDNHGMLSVTGAPAWRTVTGGSREYVRRITKQLATTHTSAPVLALTRRAGDVRLRTGDGAEHTADAVVIAVHPDQALRLLADPTPAEAEVLGAFSYSRNPALLHTDASVLPRASGARGCWNYLLPSCGASPERVLVSYDMTRLQRLDTPQPYVVTLGGEGLVDPALVLDRMDYAHPVHTLRSVAAQQRLPELNGPVTAFAGAYHGWGFHEDGCRSGVAAAAALGVRW